MTKSEWVACADPQAMIDFLGFAYTDRKRNLLRQARPFELIDMPGLGADASVYDAFRQHQQEKQKAECDRIRCIFGNTFYRITFNPAWAAWHDGLLSSMARQMYDSDDFGDMPVLADALEEAGCSDFDILNHCRQPGEHVRGCHVVDLCLGLS